MTHACDTAPTCCNCQCAFGQGTFEEKGQRRCLPRRKRRDACGYPTGNPCLLDHFLRQNEGRPTSPLHGFCFVPTSGEPKRTPLQVKGTASPNLPIFKGPEPNLGRTKGNLAFCKKKKKDQKETSPCRMGTKRSSFHGSASDRTGIRGPGQRQGTLGAPNGLGIPEPRRLQVWGLFKGKPQVVTWRKGSTRSHTNSNMLGRFGGNPGNSFYLTPR